jgi:hypothetical protein
MHEVAGNEVNEEPTSIGEYIVWSARPSHWTHLNGDAERACVRLVFRGLTFFVMTQFAVLSR